MLWYHRSTTYPLIFHIPVFRPAASIPIIVFLTTFLPPQPVTVTSSRGMKRKSDSVALDIEAGKKKPVIRTQSNTVCMNCSQIDFQKVFQLESATLADAENGILIADLGTGLARASSSSCALCGLFIAVARKFVDEDRQIELELRAFSFLRLSAKIEHNFCPKNLKPRDQPYLAVVPRNSSGHNAKFDSDEAGHIFCLNLVHQNTHIFSPRIIPHTVDFSLITQWLGYCKSRHKRLCGSKVSQLSNLKVVDCNSLSIIPAPSSCLYVALSYVWSRENRELQVFKPDQNNATALQLQHLPRSIQDAITVTKGIGFQYLWVDRFCINQGDPNEKHYQIQNMDLIYRGAEITIIAAAGSDEAYGLPGVGLTPRVPQLTATVQDVQVICTMMHPHHSILGSSWSTRGWTYQEAVLSRRRIVFTDCQVYFECDAMNCYESLRGDLDTLHTKTKDKSLMMLHNGIFGGREGQCFAPSDIESYSLSAALERYLRLITNYSSRDLTFEDDSLNAFTGIARHLEKSIYPFFHLWGLPFPSPSLTPTPSDDRKYLSVALLWAHICNADPDLKEVKASRRPAFPSWSWAGWKGKVIFQRRLSVWLDDFDCKIQNIHFEFEPGILAEQNYFLRHCRLEEVQICRPRGLHLDVLIVSPTLLSLSNDNLHPWQLAGKKATFYLSQQATVNSDDPLSILDKFKTQKWTLILIGRKVLSAEPTKTYLIVVEQQTSFVSRVGMAVVDGLDITDVPSKDWSPGRVRLL